MLSKELTLKYSAYLATGLIGILVLTGISTANAQMMGAKPLSRGDVQLVQKQQGKQHMLKGHRGMKERRQGYRRHSDGYWYPPAAFASEAPKKKPGRSDKAPSPVRKF
ncbi:hypothetical protein ASG19_16045 [Rhizobium sp. Leaf306]|nr:hypothetical protein ASG19_16045 [Rhizobium sp. Leaf306]